MVRFNSRWIPWVLTLWTGATTASAETFATEEREREFLRFFHEDPVAAYQTIPPKFGPAESERLRPSFATKQAIRGKIMLRNKQYKTRADEKTGYRPTDDPRQLVDNSEDLVHSLAAAEEQELKSSSLPVEPWSDDYWGMYLGGVGARYGDPEFPNARDWQENYNYIQDLPVSAIIEQGPEAVEDLSPGEKYSLIIGDEDDKLTAYAWREGESYYNETGEVETWFGICHGWAPASYMLPRPSTAIEVPAAKQDLKVKLFPSDIKALASLLWAKASAPTRFVGGRCNTKDPEQDDMGRIIDEKCFDSNPATFHLALINQVGVSQRGFVMDANFDYEVWNQPVHAYEYKYFNPETEEITDNLADATIALEDYSKDKFAKYRDERTKSVVGIMVYVTYRVETSPSQRLEDSPEHDRSRRVRYTYDLEIDDKGEVIGGEWYQRAHPDFLWTPAPGVKVRTPQDMLAKGEWAEGQPVPEGWREPASQAARYGQPLGHIVEELFERAQLQEENSQ